MEDHRAGALGTILTWAERWTLLRKLSFIGIVLALFTVILVMCLPFDPDMWWHLRVGQSLSSGRNSAPPMIFMLPWVYATLADVPLIGRLASPEAERWFGIRRAPLYHN